MNGKKAGFCDLVYLLISATIAGTCSFYLILFLRIFSSNWESKVEIFSSLMQFFRLQFNCEI